MIERAIGHVVAGAWSPANKTPVQVNASTFRWIVASLGYIAFIGIVALVYYVTCRA